ncbi:MAG: hypothetical protein ACPG7F_09605, partial [Aggregatilineales bacterium]
EPYVPNYTSRETDNKFLYTGSNWTSLGGVDYTGLEPGAGIMFRTDNADALIIQRDIRSTSGMTVCAAPVSNLADRNCQTYENFGSTKAIPVSFYLNNTGDTSEHVVSVTATNRNRLYVPGFKPTATGTFQPGIYDDLDPSISYQTTSEQLVTNGDMALDNATWNSVGTVTSNTKTFAARRRVETGGVDSGIESLEFDIVSGEYYTIMGTFYFPVIYAGTLNMQLMDGVTVLAEIPVPERIDTNDVLLRNRALPVRFDYLSDANRTVKVRFVSSTAGTFEVDDVFAHTGGGWEFVRYPFAYGGSYSRSTIPGSGLNFSFTGTGFSLGTVMDGRGGELEVCYDDDATFEEDVETGIDEHCFIYQQEILGLYVDVSRTVPGLPLNTYYVRVRDVEDGYRDVSVINDYTARAGIFKNGQISIDYLYVYGPDDLPETIENSVTVNEDADINDDGERELVLLPEDRWADTTGPRAARYSDSSYSGTVNYRNGFNNTRDTGSAGMIKLNLDTYSEASVVLYTGVTSRSLSSEFLVCVDDVNGEINYKSATRSYELINSTSCMLTGEMVVSPQIVFNSANLPPLGMSGQDVTLTFRSLDPSLVTIDGYQVFYDTTLGEGFYEDSLLTGTATYNNAEWEEQAFALYSSDRALVTETASPFQFEFTGTGFTLLSHIFRDAGTVDVFVDGIQDFNTTFDLDSNISVYETGFTFAGLPDDTYTVTLTPQSNFKFVVDGLYIYGALTQLGSLYDDSQKDVATGNLLLSYGPDSAWVAVSGGPAIRSLNKTYHSTSKIGAAVTFEVGATTPATGIIIYDTNSITRDIEICWRDAAIPTNVTCTSEDLFLDRTGRVSVNAPAPGHYFVTIVNKERRSFVLDAIQVLEGEFAEGIYNIAYMDANNVFQNAGSDWTINTTTNSATGLNNGSQLEFDFTGIGFSIELKESIVTAETYDICVETIASTCNILDENLVRPAGSVGTNALTYMGFSQPDGSNDTYTVRLTNTDATSRDIVVNQLHVMGAKDNFTISGSDIVENDDPRIRVLPFGVAENIVDRFQRVSGETQTSIRMYGATIYFEFEDDSLFEYVRQTLVSYADVEICYGQINASPATNSGNTVNCETVENNNSNSYKNAEAISTGLDCSAPGCWATITSKSFRAVSTFDYVRLLDLSQPLSAGTYDDSFAALYGFEQTGTGPDTYDTEPGDTVTINVRNQVNIRADGGSTRYYEDLVDGGNATAMAGGMFFQMQGTGFGISFMQDIKSDEVNICYLLNGTNAQDTINNGVCQTYDNYLRGIGSRARTIAGLPFGNYGVAIQMLPDNGTPLAHRANELPLGMQIDAVEVYNQPFFDGAETNWATPATEALNVLTPGTTYEFNYANRLSDNNFQYYGDSWAHRPGSRVFYSESSFDIIRETGAGVVFRTNGA